MGAYREAVLVIHGMGEQRPLETLDRLVRAILAPADPEHRDYYSRPTDIGESYEARRYIVPPVHGDDVAPGQNRPQRELFEYHWSPRMKGNRLDDLFATTRRILFSRPRNVPGGILGAWLAIWLIVVLAAVGAAALWSSGSDVGSFWTKLLATVPGAAVLSPILGYLVTRVLPRAMTASFVDVVRYLDTSPRSYDVRRDIRAGAISLLRDLNERYDRVTIVAHSLGSYIAYDAIRHLWGELHDRYDPETGPSRPRSDELAAALHALDDAATALERDRSPDAEAWTAFRAAQRRVYEALRDDGNAWRITDLITFGSPMYMADRIYTRTRDDFDERVQQLEFPTCPPAADDPSWHERRDDGSSGQQGPVQRWAYRRRREGDRLVLHQAAPFAPMRWTNVWFPTKWLFLGDWFGGPLGPLFGHGVRDVPIESGPYRLRPATAHSFYFEAIADGAEDQIAKLFQAALLAHPPTEPEQDEDTDDAQDSAVAEDTTAPALARQAPEDES